MGLKEVVRGGFGIVNGVFRAPFFREDIYCQSCRCDVSKGKIVVSRSGRAYCDNEICLLNATIYGDEVINPKTNGKTYSPIMARFAVGRGRLVHYKEPQDIARSPR